MTFLPPVETPQMQSLGKGLQIYEPFSVKFSQSRSIKG